MNHFEDFNDRSGHVKDETRMECKICWYVYDPAQGDDYWQIPPGTSFNDLPDDWSCPECDAKKSDFLILDD